MDPNILLKVGGGSVGLLLTGLSGNYVLIKLFLVNYFSVRLYERINKKINDKEACLVFSSPWVPEKSGYALIMQLIITIGETLSLDNYRPLLYVCGGSVTSYVSVFVAKRLFFNGYNNPDLISAERRVLNLFFISIASMEIGKLLTEYGYNFFQYISYCQTAAQTLDKLSQPYVKALSMDCPRPSQFISFWFNPKPSIPLNWLTNAGEYYETNCHLEIIDRAKSGWITCDPPRLSPILRLRGG